MLAGLSLSEVALSMAAGLLLDWLFGEVRRWHPLVGFGRYANGLEHRLNRAGSRFARGAIGWLAAIVPPLSLAVLLSFTPAAWLWHVLLLYFGLGLRSLSEHALPIGTALQAGDLPLARSLTARIVSRDTDSAGETELAKAGVESLLENGNDAVFGTLFWFAVAGGPGVMLFRLANTLDAMWGYRTARYRAFGCVAARSDDALNWLPARLTALSYALLGNTRLAWQCWRTQARAWDSPNAGPVMAAGAGALQLALGGVASYHGAMEQRPPLGIGKPAGAADIGRAWRLVAGTTLLWLAVTGTAAVLWEISHA